MVTLVVKGHVEVDYITIEEDSFIEDAVADDLVDGRAHRFGEVIVIQRRRVRTDRELGWQDHQKSTTGQ